jgi:hypothetical protein
MIFFMFVFSMWDQWLLCHKLTNSFVAGDVPKLLLVTLTDLDDMLGH